MVLHKKTRKKKSRAKRGVRRHKGSAPQDKMRVRILLGFMMVIICIIMTRLWFLQVRGGEDFRNRASAQYNMTAEIVPNRGTIFMQDRGGRYPVAINKAFGLLYVVPAEIVSEERENVLNFLREIVVEEEFDEDLIRIKIAKENDPYEVIARKIDSEEVHRRVRDTELVGIYMLPEMYRFYPGNEIGAQVVGFVGSDGEKYRGRYGAEAAFDKILAGESGEINQLRDAGGRWISITDRTQQRVQNGSEIELTLDYSVQYEVEKILENTVSKHSADAGSIIVMRPDGSILAMASQPRFNPNEYGLVDDISRYLNPIVSYEYESGSVVKPLTMAAGIDAGVITPTSTYVDTGVVFEAGYDIRNSEEKVYGLQTMTNVLEESINTGVIHVERLVGHKRFAEYFDRFGYGHKTGINLPGEARGNIRNMQAPIRPIQLYTASFGQGITMTLLQLAQSYAVLANDGMLMRPRIIERIHRDDGSVEEYAPEEIHRVIHAKSAQQVREMLASVVINGHGKRAAVPGYRIGGKTGTAQVAKSGARGYDDSITIGSFAGIAPIDEPQFIVVTRIDNPKDVQWAESTAAPAFQKVMKFLLEYYNVSPTEEIIPTERDVVAPQTHE